MNAPLPQSPPLPAAATVTPALLPLGLLQPSPTNPRKRFPAGPLHTLTDSIAQHALLQPIIVRPLAGRPEGQPQYEVVAGERRWRACTQLAAEGRNPHGQAIPALVCAFTDAEVLVVQLTENIQREDLHPLEEGQHYHAMREAGISLEDIAHAARVGEARVRQRLQLLQLQPAAQEAFIAGRLTLGLAHQVARLPAAQQAEAVQHLSDWGGEPMGTKAAAAFIRDRLMLRLAEAPFDTTDATLHPAAGACSTCPHRTGANPQLWEDITDADRCANPPCFSAKKVAHRARLVDQLASTGYTIHQGDAARALCTADGRDLKPGMLPVESAVPYELGDTTLKVADVLVQARAPQHHTHVVDHPNGAPLLYAVAKPELEHALRTLKAHRSQLPGAAPASTKPSKAPATPKAPSPQMPLAGSPPAADAPAPAPQPAAQPAPSAPDALDLQAETQAEWLAALLHFHVPATVNGRYNGATATEFVALMQQRTRSILAAVRVAHHLRQHGADGHLAPALAPLLAEVLTWCLNVHSPHSAWQLMERCGVEPPAECKEPSVRAWADQLQPDHASRAALLLLTLQDEGPQHCTDRYINAVAATLGLDMADLAPLAAEHVQHRMTLGALATGKPTSPRSKRAAA